MQDSASYELDLGEPSTSVRLVPALVAVAVICASALAGCASSDERPEGALAAAETSIRAAQQAGARDYGREPLATAREKLAAAQTAVERDEMEVAGQLAEEAALDAELAGAMARNRKAELAVAQLEETIEVLREEITRSQAAAGEL